MSCVPPLVLVVLALVPPPPPVPPSRAAPRPAPASVPRAAVFFREFLAVTALEAVAFERAAPEAAVPFSAFVFAGAGAGSGAEAPFPFPVFPAVFFPVPAFPDPAFPADCFAAAFPACAVAFVSFRDSSAGTALPDADCCTAVFFATMAAAPFHIL
ncbi:hypothetical protein [Streptomyces hirsutus]|uniref:hypothetical protein n=1 Tax=Streptomyces hirsutus TaxID=35620 RepID=UPI003F4B2BCF